MKSHPHKPLVGLLGQDQCAASPQPMKIKHLEVNGMNKSHTERGVFPSEATVAELHTEG